MRHFCIHFVQHGHLERSGQCINGETEPIFITESVMESAVMDCELSSSQKSAYLTTFCCS